MAEGFRRCRRAGNTEKPFYLCLILRRWFYSCIAQSWGRIRLETPSKVFKVERISSRKVEKVKASATGIVRMERKTELDYANKVTYR